jgi:hypothetical protein
MLLTAAFKSRQVQLVYGEVAVRNSAPQEVTSATCQPTSHNLALRIIKVTFVVAL